MSTKTVKFFVEGMNCGGCVSAIEDALNAHSYISNVGVDLDSKSVILTTDEPVDSVKAILSDAGFDAVEA